ncbi:MAG: MFS transporter [Chloroflexota bacterium]|nr:MFS transporter [Chloroflexota bacterium]
MRSARAGRRRPLTGRTPFYYGWVILGVAALGIFASGPGQTYNFSVFLDPVIEETGWTRTQITGLYAAGSLTAAVLIIGVGRLLDRYGARVVLSAVVALFGLAALWMSRVDTPLDLYLGFAFIRTLGQGSMTMVPTTLVAIWFVRRRGRATALAMLGGAASAMAFPLVSHALITEFGWRTAWVALAFVIWGLMLLPALLLVRRSPESVGLAPDNARGGDGAADAASSVADDFSMREAMRTRAFWFLLLAGSSFSLIGTALTFHNVSLLTGKGLDAGTAAGVLSVMAAASIGANLAAGYLNDRFPNRFVFAGAQCVLVGAMLFTFVVSSAWLALAYGAILGAGMGLGMNTNTVIWPNYFGRRNLGSIRGMAMTSTMAFAALGPLPFSMLYDLSDSYDLALVVFLALPAACAALALLSPRPIKQAARRTIRGG